MKHYSKHTHYLLLLTMVCTVLFISARLFAADQVMVATGADQSCQLKVHHITCFGDNTAGAVTPPLMNQPSWVSVSSLFGCAIDGDNIICWGDNTYLQLEVPMNLIEKPLAVEVGINHACTLTATDVICWGWRKDNRTNVPILRNPRQLSVFGSHSCVLDDEGVKCWGKGLADNLLTPPTLKNPRQVSAGDSRNCAIDDDGIKCWGIGFFDDGSPYSPNDAPPKLKDIQSISIGSTLNCAVYDHGKTTCWGSEQAQFNIDIVSQLPAVKSISAHGFEHGCAVLETDEIRCFGNNTNGQLGPYLPADTDINNIQLTSQIGWLCVDAGLAFDCFGDFNGIHGKLKIPANASDPAASGWYSMEHYCYLLKDSATSKSTVECVSSEVSPLSSTPPLLSPYQLIAGKDWYCAAVTGGVRCWAAKLDAALPSAQLESITIANSISKMAAGSGHLCLLAQGNLSCYGANDFGQINVPSDMRSEVIDVVAAEDVTCARTLLQLKCWGYHSYGSRPLTVTNQPLEMTVGTEGFCSIDSNHTLTCDGDNIFMDNFALYPTKDAAKVVIKAYFPCILYTDSTLLCNDINSKLIKIDVPEAGH